MAFEIAKAGWVHRLSSFLRRWKRNWLVLYQDGSLKYFENPDSHTAEEVYPLPTNCLAIYSGEQVIGDPPPGFGRTCMFSVALKDDTTLVFCAEGTDDMSAWQMALEEARVMRMRPASAPSYAPAGSAPPYAPAGSSAPPYAPVGSSAPPYAPAGSAPPYAPSPFSSPGYPGQVLAYPGAEGQMRYIPHSDPYGQAGQTRVVYTDDPYYHDDMRYGRHRRRGHGNGDMAVGLVGGMALGSLMWGPMLWW